MTRLAMIIACLATPLHAADAAQWGVSINPDFNTSATLAAGKGPAVATVTIRNRLTGGHDSTTDAMIDIPGLSVGISIWHGPGDTPDTAMVTPPQGYIAVPPQIDVPEGGEAVITIYSADGVGA